ncbi:NAD(P)H-dependent oxidoreductase [Parapedobacter koreensis]|uniref:Modulator of drug activity B n=1 Tax=Parapedobacter koreensis TaxID=332977 RepID=A0A1H7LWC1_9SPHI|nr:NAD(P)H-dependent oxidoreductase [Parapedobacter koreensis]SEL02617.1 modulator of drug activity B [Parapedobacter koreensis]
MKKVFIINGGQDFGHSGGRFNRTIADTTADFFGRKEDAEVQITHIADGYDPLEEVAKFVWADVVIYHTPIWWFQLPHGFKKYIDDVFTAGHRRGIYHSDGRKADNPTVNYGTGGELQGRRYLLTTTWNAPATAFTLPGEFFQHKSVDDGPLFGFHRMNAFAGMAPLESFHFHDVEKNADVPRDMTRYRQHLQDVFNH